MFGGPELSSGPDLQHVSNDEENGARHGRSLHPVPGAVQHLQTAAVLLQEERDAAEVGVGGAADGAGRHRLRQRRVVGRPHVRVPVALLVPVAAGQQTRPAHRRLQTGQDALTDRCKRDVQRHYVPAEVGSVLRRQVPVELMRVPGFFQLENVIACFRTRHYFTVGWSVTVDVRTTETIVFKFGFFWESKKGAS